jgi:hypothetical protein
MPSLPVQSARGHFRLCEKRRHSSGFGGAADSLAGDCLVFRPGPEPFQAWVSARHFLISVWRGGVEKLAASRPGTSRRIGRSSCALKILRCKALMSARSRSPLRAVRNRIRELQ